MHYQDSLGLSQANRDMISNISSSVAESDPLTAEQIVQKVLDGLNTLTSPKGAKRSEEHLLRVREAIYIFQDVHFPPQRLFEWLDSRRISRPRHPGLTEWDEVGETLLKHSGIPADCRAKLFTTRSRRWSNLDDIGKKVNEEHLGASDTSSVSLLQIQPSGSDLDLEMQSEVFTQQTNQTQDQTSVDDGFSMDIDQSPVGTGPEVEDTVDVEMSKLGDTWNGSHGHYWEISTELSKEKRNRLFALETRALRDSQVVQEGIEEIARRPGMGYFVPGIPHLRSERTEDVEECVELTKWLAAADIYPRRKEPSLEKHIYKYLWGYSHGEDFSHVGSSAVGSLASASSRGLSDISQPDLSSNESR
ncbi:hypothetical protein HD553DRAFT_343604 [Filobasidium floriforme]|uniref:uncharacterized protein n=1 Tax=Filobasidium floriforme TaxID=5210 RepID=UPI001E8CB017|nr:uncharacterized protein HD553DRAFT_343604 [Filobasidium floriforme]KAH8082216.1 hypothetical protein HD553DRAFT_343604 [Filobasidium floriforme]